MSGSLFDDDDLSTVPVGEYVPHHYTLIPEVQRLAPGDRRERQTIAAWLSSNAASPALLESLRTSEFADLLRAAS